MSRNSYSSYRGRTPLWKILLIIALAAILLLACLFLFLQRYLVYDTNGNAKLIFPWQEEQTVDLPEEDEDLKIIISEPDLKNIKELKGVQLTLPLSALPALAEGQNSYAVTLKTADGLLHDGANPAAENRAQDALSAELLAALLDNKTHSIARMSLLHDSLYAKANAKAAGLCRKSGSIWYDNQSTHWLDPAKPAARQYLAALAGDYAKLGFHELLLEDFGYPTRGKLQKIDYGSSPREEAVLALLQEIKAALAPYKTQLSLVLPAEVVLDGASEPAGLKLSALLPLADRVYVKTTEAELPALREKLGADVFFVPILKSAPASGGNYLLEK